MHYVKVSFQPGLGYVYKVRSRNGRTLLMSRGFASPWLAKRHAFALKTALARTNIFEVI